MICSWLTKHPEVLQNRSVLELGSGLGLCGLVATKLSPISVYLTDFNDKVLENLQYNASLNLADGDTVAQVSRSQVKKERKKGLARTYVSLLLVYYPIVTRPACNGLMIGKEVGLLPSSRGLLLRHGARA